MKRKLQVFENKRQVCVTKQRADTASWQFPLIMGTGKAIPQAFLVGQKGYRLQTLWTFLSRNHHHQQLHREPVMSHRARKGLAVDGRKMKHVQAGHWARQSQVLLWDVPAYPREAWDRPSLSRSPPLWASLCVEDCSCQSLMDRSLEPCYENKTGN